MFTSQLSLTTNNQTSERNAKMESQVVVNRITDKVKDEYAVDLLKCLQNGLKRAEAKDVAYSFVCHKFSLTSLTAYENGLLGKVAQGVYKYFYSPKEKTCSRCGKPKAFHDFATDKASPDKKQSWCRVCYHKYNAEKRESKRAVETINLDSLFNSKQVTVKDFSMIFTRNGMQVKYTNNEFLYSPAEGSQFNDSDVDDLLILRSEAKQTVQRVNGSN